MSASRPRIAFINDAPIRASERCFHWAAGRRLDDHAGLTEPGF